MNNVVLVSAAKVAARRTKRLTQFRERFTACEPVEGKLHNKNAPSEARDSQIHILRRQKYIFYIDSAVFSFENDPKILPWLNALPLLPRLPNTDSVSLSKPNFEKTL